MARSAKSRRALSKDYRAEVKAIQRSARKRGLFASVGGFLGGALAASLTGGAAAPIVAAMMAGGGNYMGRKLGAKLSKTDIKKAGGGKFAQSARGDLVNQLKQQDIVSGLKGGLFAGIGQMGGLSKILGKGKGAASASSTKVAGEGLKQGIFPKGTFKNLFKSSNPEALASQEGIGSLIDFRGSSIGKGLQTMAFKDKGWIDPNLQSAEGWSPHRFEGDMPIVAMDRRLHTPGPEPIQRAKDFLDMETSFSDVGPSEFDRTFEIRRSPALDNLGLDPSSEIGDAAYDIKYKTPGIKGSLQRFFGGTSGPTSQGTGAGWQSDIPLGKTLDQAEKNIYDNYGKIMDRPNVPVASGYNEGFNIADKDINVENVEFSNFNEASWREGADKIQAATKQAYWGSETPAVRGLSAEPIGTGLSPEMEAFHGEKPIMSQLGVDLSKYDLLQESTIKANKLRQDASRYKRLFGNRKGI